MWNTVDITRVSGLRLLQDGSKASGVVVPFDKGAFCSTSPLPHCNVWRNFCLWLSTNWSKCLLLLVLLSKLTCSWLCSYQHGWWFFQKRKTTFALLRCILSFVCVYGLMDLSFLLSRDTFWVTFEPFLFRSTVPLLFFICGRFSSIAAVVIRMLDSLWCGATGWKPARASSFPPDSAQKGCFPLNPRRFPSEQQSKIWIPRNPLVGSVS